MKAQVICELFLILAVVSFSPQSAALKKYFISTLSPPCEGREKGRLSFTHKLGLFTNMGCIYGLTSQNLIPLYL